MKTKGAWHVVTVEGKPIKYILGLMDDVVADVYEKHDLDKYKQVSFTQMTDSQVYNLMHMSVKTMLEESVEIIQLLYLEEGEE